MPRARGDERREVGERARDHDVERRRRREVLDARGRRRSTLRERRARSTACVQERALLVVAVEQRRRASRAARSRAGCRARRRRCRRRAARSAVRARQVRQHGERVEHVVRDHALRLADRGQVVRAVPLREQREVGERAASRCAGGSATPRAPRARAECPRRASATPASRGHRRRCRAGTRRAGCGAARKPRFRCTSSSEIAAGVMPEMRAAWPIVSGRCWLSFCCTSVDRPRTVAVVEVRAAARSSSCARCRAISSLLAVDVARVLGRDLDLLGDDRIGDRRARRRAASAASRRSRRDGAAGRRARTRARSAARARAARRARRRSRGFTQVDFRRSRSRAIASRLRANASQRASSTRPSARPRLGQAQVGVVLAQLQPVLGARGEHPVRLGDAAGDEVVDQHAEVGLVAARAPARLAAHAAARR